MISLVLDPLVLLLLMWLFARHDADFSYLKVLLITFCVAIIASFLASFHPIIGSASYVVLIPFALHRFCYISLKQAFIITGIFMAWQIIWHLMV